MEAREKLPPEKAVKASLIAAAMIANATPKSKANWPLVVAGLPVGTYHKITEKLPSEVACYFPKSF